MLRFVWLILLFAFSVPALAKPVFLMVAVLDGHKEITPRTLEAYTDYIKKQRPDLRLIPIIVDGDPNRLSSRDMYVEDQLKQKIEKIDLASDDVIAYISIDTHGGTSVGGASNQQQTLLQYFGAISPEGPSAAFDHIFGSIRNRAANDLIFILNSCSTMCGTEREASERAQAVLNYFNAPNGMLYGGTTKEAFFAGDIPGSLKLRDMKPSRHFLTHGGPFFTMYLIELLGKYGSLRAIQTPHEMVHALLLTGAAFIYSVVYKPIAGRRFVLSGELNQGRIFVSTDGKIEEVIPVSKTAEKLALISQEALPEKNCESTFLK